MTGKKLRPRLRPVDAFTVEQDGQTLIAVRDPLSYAPNPLLVPPHVFYLLTLMDGTRSVADILAAFSEQFDGVDLPASKIQELVRSLDDQFFLDGASARNRIEQIDTAFREAGVRKSWHAGQAYPAEAFELLGQISDFYKAPDGAGVDAGSSSVPLDRVEAILAPHIDLRTGGPCFTHAYRPLLESLDAEVYVILGVAHYGDGRFFIGTDKAFETPLGLVETDRELLGAWADAVGRDMTQGQIAHRTEHSIEFQLLFLQQGLAGRPFKILPILCGPLEPFLQAGSRPEQDAEVGPMLEGLAQAIGASGRRVRYVVSVDLAHVGPKFGDPDPITDDAAARHEERDRALLETAARGDAGGLFETLRRDNMNARRVDAAAALYTMLYLLPGIKGEVVAYGQDRQPDTGSMVTYASMVFRCGFTSPRRQ